MELLVCMAVLLQADPVWNNHYMCPWIYIYIYKCIYIYRDVYIYIYRCVYNIKIPEIVFVLGVVML